MLIEKRTSTATHYEAMLALRTLSTTLQTLRSSVCRVVSSDSRLHCLNQLDVLLPVLEVKEI